MNKSVLISIRPTWCAAIAHGKKTVEVRKSRPNIDPPFKCYVYCTKAQNKNEVWTPCNSLSDIRNGKVIGEFTCDRIYRYTTTAIKDGADISDEDMERLSCLSRTELAKYEHSSPAAENRIQYFGLYGWRITDFKLYDTPKSLSDFREWTGKPANGWYRKPLTRAPQSWQYVIGEDDS